MTIKYYNVKKITHICDINYLFNFIIFNTLQNRNILYQKYHFQIYTRSNYSILFLGKLKPWPERMLFKKR